MPYPAFAAGQRLTAALLSAMQTQLIRKSADQSVTNSTTLVNAVDMSVPLAAGATYMVRLRACYSASTTGDIKLAWTAPAGTTVQRYGISPALAATDTTATSVRMRRQGQGTTVGAGADGTGVSIGYWEDILVAAPSAGTLQLQFAQNAVDATNATILRADSYIEYLRVG